MAPRKRLPGVDDELQKILDANMDQVPSRRRAREAFKDIQHGIDHILFKVPCDQVKMEESYEVNSRGIEIFTKSWLPKTSKPKATVFYCHGYGDTCTFFFEGIARKLALSGFGVFAMDYPGFGLSEGLHCHIPSFNRLVDDVIEHYSKVKDDMVPPWLLTQILIGMSRVLPKSKLVPQKDLAEAAFRDVKKREQAAYNVVAYKDKPRLQTAVEMLKTTQEIGQRLEEVSLPLLILQGEADTVTDPSVSKALYEKASSSDKTLKLYKEAYHCVLDGEPDDIIIQVFNDIVSWLDQHSS